MKANLVVKHLITGIFEDFEKTTISTSLGKRGVPATSFKRVSRTNKASDMLKHVINLSEFDSETFDTEALESVEQALTKKEFMFPLQGVSDETLYQNVRRAFSSVFEINKQIDFDLFDSLYRINLWKALELVNQEIYFNFKNHHKLLTGSDKLSGLLDCNTNQSELLGLDKAKFINTSFNREKNVGIPVSLYSMIDSTDLVFLANNEDQHDMFEENGYTLNQNIIDTLNGAFKYQAMHDMENLKVWIVAGHNRMMPRTKPSEYVPFCRMYSVELPSDGESIDFGNLQEVSAVTPKHSIFSTFSFFRKSMKLNMGKALKEVVAEKQEPAKVD